ncbi:fungal-specific transcription factor domain-containing protein [Aspergillus keveii]|uniref:Fungal-specific transcription factor domain-containing protein n=1 Tax=Aspergillus keveii TaxID=714993 RepID=A0ABR4FRX6_9EURO
MPSPVPLTISEHGQQVIEYYGELNSVTVLSEVLGQSQRRLIRLDLPGPAAVGALQREFSRLDEADVAYLRGKHVHDFPPPTACRGFLHLFFKRVYPYTPILNRQQFFEDYERGTCSSFLLWSIFANVAPYASPELLLESGYTEYSMAQKAFFSKARLLYDFGCEKGQLNLLQGSILLSSFQFTFAPDKDFRFWFHNAARIALQMGLNRRDIGNQLDLPTYHLIRRIWWVIYSRDVWFSVVGFENARRIHDDGTEMVLLKPEDWAEELLIPPHYKDIIPDITPLQQHFFTEICRLNLLGSHFLSLLGPNRPTPTLPEAHAFTSSITTWRTSFPEDLLLDRVYHWDDSNARVLFLWSMGFRLECSFYRTLRQRTKGIDEESAAWANERLRRCIFELDTVLKRAVVNDVALFCPPSLIICTSHLLALQLEVALDPTAPEPQRIAAKTQIHTGLAYLRGIGDRWLNAKWTFRVFDSVTRRLGMPMGGHDLPTSRYPAGPSNDPGLWRHASVNTGSIAQMPIDLGQSQPQPQDELALPDRWIESLLTENLMNGLDDGMFNMFMP